MDKLMAPLRKMAIFKRLTITFFIILLIPSAVLNLYSYNKFREEIEKLSTQNTLAIMKQVEYILSDALLEYEKLAYSIYTNPKIIDALKICNDFFYAKPYMPEKKSLALASKQFIGQTLFETVRSSPYVSNIQIVTPKEQFLLMDPSNPSRSGYIKDHYQFTHSPYYTETIAAKGAPIWWDTSQVFDLFYRKGNNTFGITETLTLTQSIQNPYSSNPLGILVMNINIGFLTNLLSSSQVSSTGNLLLASPKGVIKSLYQSSNAPIIKSNATLSKILEIPNTPTQSLLLDDTYCFLVYEQLFPSSLFLVHIMDYKELVRTASDIFYTNFKLMFIWLIIAIILSLLVTLSISIPINRLKECMELSSQGNLNAHYLVTGKDEISILGNKFNEMLISIKKLIDKIYVSELAQKDLAFRKKNAELNALQMQINPHFLYNTLDIIRWEAMYQENGDGKVSQMIEDFSNLLRLGTKTNTDYVTLEEELTHVEAYLKVINYRYNHSIKLFTDLSLDTSTYFMPKLTLQPLIENAVLHGFDGFDGEKHLFIKGAIVANDIELSISNTGWPISSKQLEELHARLTYEGTSPSSIGLSNVNERMKLYFGTHYTIHIKNENNQLTTIVLRFTKIINQEDMTHV